MLGQLQPTGVVPTFIEEIKTRGVDLDRSIFDNSQYQNNRWGK